MMSEYDSCTSQDFTSALGLLADGKKNILAALDLHTYTRISVFVVSCRGFLKAGCSCAHLRQLY